MSADSSVKGNRMVSIAEGTHTHGLGLTVRKSFAKGELIYRFPGQSVRQTPTYQSIQIGMDRHTLDLGLLAYMNHACDPSAVIDTENRSVLAVRSIAAGDELTFFYPSTEWDMARPFVCQCRAPQCLSLITGAKYLAPDVLKHYFINPHILRMHSEKHAGRL